jgi:mannose-6-phosphate isomerase
VLTPLRVAPLARERVWGGTRLMAPRTLPIGELWLAGPWIEVAVGPYAGRTLDDVARELGADFVGSAAPADPGTGPRFPLLAKLLDPAAWLSVQVHPDDAVARRLEGPGAVGKAEAWYVVDAEPGAELLVGLRPGVTLAAARAAITLPAERRGTAVVDLLARLAVGRGDAITLPPGTLHAVGPGVLLYEIQQPSDLTYRVDDWGRPATDGRPLHLEQALASIGVDGPPEIRRSVPPGRVLALPPHFALDLVAEPAHLDPAGRTLHVVTALDGPAILAGPGWTERLAPRESLVVPATAGGYALEPEGATRVLVAALP